MAHLLYHQADPLYIDLGIIKFLNWEASLFIPPERLARQSLVSRVTRWLAVHLGAA